MGARRKSASEIGSSGCFHAVRLSGGDSLAYIRTRAEGIVEVLVGAKAFEGDLRTGTTIRGLDVSPSQRIVLNLLSAPNVVGVMNSSECVVEQSSKSDVLLLLSAADDGMVLELSITDNIGHLALHF